MRCCRTNHLTKARIIRKHHLLETLVAILYTIYVASNLVTATCSRDLMLIRAREANNTIGELLQDMTIGIENGTGINGMDEVRDNIILLRSSTLTNDDILTCHYRSLCIFESAVLNMNNLREPGSEEFRTKLINLHQALRILRNKIRNCLQGSMNGTPEVSYDSPCDTTCTSQRNLHVSRLMLHYVGTLINSLHRL